MENRRKETLRIKMRECEQYIHLFNLLITLEDIYFKKELFISALIDLLHYKSYCWMLAKLLLSSQDTNF